MISQQIDMKFIKSHLDRGEIAKLAKDKGLTPDQGYKILGGKSKNHEFVLYCFQRAIDRAKMYLALNQLAKEQKEKIEAL